MVAASPIFRANSRLMESSGIDGRMFSRLIRSGSANTKSNAIAAELGSNGRGGHRPSTRYGATEADFRDYGIGAQILRDVGVRKMIIMSDATPRLANLPGYGLEMVGSVPLTVPNGKPASSAK